MTGLTKNSVFNFNDDELNYISDETKKLIIKAKCRLYKIRTINDERGSISSFNFGDFLPENPKRSYYIYDVPNNTTRGDHAHKKCAQFFICLKGSVLLSLDTGNIKFEITLRDPKVGIYVPPMIWNKLSNFSNDCLLMIWASDHYLDEDYIRIYDEFLNTLKK